MDKRFDHKKVEQRIYKMWEEGGYFKPRNLDSGKKPFTILLPPPNASGKMHIGNVLMIAIEDLMIRWHRMKGDPTLWVPGTDHAGFETQITFERKLKKEGKSRFDYDRQTLYQMIWEFVKANKGTIEKQIRRMGASVDWSRYTFTLDPKVIETVYKTFEKMYSDGLIYRDNYIVNYCPKCGTTFADLEIKHIERKDPLYYVRYPLIKKDKNNEPDYLVVATVRPETIMVDTHLAVHPKDKKNAKWIGRKVKNPLTDKEMEILGDNFVDPEFGTGIVKLTPAHDKHDWEVGLKHHLPVISMLDMNGRLTKEAGEFAGLKVKEARKRVVEKLESKNLIEKIDENYKHAVAVCYKGGHDIEPMVLPNWFVKVDSLKKPAHEVVKTGKVKIFPKWQEITYHRWMEEMRDWPISRQVVWGIRIPVWYRVGNQSQNTNAGPTMTKQSATSDKNKKIRVVFKNKAGEVVSGEIGKLLEKYSIKEIKEGLQNLIAPKEAEFVISKDDPGEEYLPETDTFDTWFSSGHWPLVTLGYPDGEDFKYFYPTSVLETGWEIIRFWVSRMIMFGIYLTGKEPFKYVYLHGLVRARDGRKMSKSLGNIIDPEEYMDKYGVDALRMGLISGTATGKDFSFPHDKVVAYRNFANKIWNMARFMELMFDQWGKSVPFYNQKVAKKLTTEDKEILSKLETTVKQVNQNLEKFRFAQAGEIIYHFLWDDVANVYIENVKQRKDKEVALSVLRHVFINGIKLLHPFMPFVTEAIWEHIPGIFEPPYHKEPLIISSWPDERVNQVH